MYIYLGLGIYIKVYKQNNKILEAILMNAIKSESDLTMNLMVNAPRA